MPLGKQPPQLAVDGARLVGAAQDREAGRAPRALADAANALVLEPRQNLGDGGAGESAALRRGEIVADLALALADGGVATARSTTDERGTRSRASG